MSLFNLKDTLGGDDNHLGGDFDGGQFYGAHGDSAFGGQDHSGAGFGFPGYGGPPGPRGGAGSLMGGLSQAQPAGFRPPTSSAPGGPAGNAAYPGGLRLPGAGNNYNTQSASLLGGAIGLNSMQGQQQPPGVRMMPSGSSGKPADEDFPALPGSSGSSKLDHSSSLSLNSSGGGNSIFGLDMNVLGGDKASVIGAVGSLRGVSALSSNTSAADPGPTLVSSGVLGATPQQPGGSSGLLANLGLAVSSSPATQQAPTMMSKEMKFGLAGLLEIIRSTDKDSYALALGTDLTTFGLNLNASESLYPNFMSPLTESSQNEDPQFKVPQCYIIHPASIKLEQFGKFQVETLFYMFYQLPKDVLQALAAQELYKRDWRYHSELMIWLKPRTQQDLMQAHPTIQFVYFETKSWETRLFNAPVRGNLVAGIVPEEEIRVKIPGPGQGSLVEPA